MKLSLRNTTLVAAVLMSLCLLRTLFRSVIYDLLLAGHPIRTCLFGDMMWCVAAMAIALFFWGVWKYTRLSFHNLPITEKKRIQPNHFLNKFPKEGSPFSDQPLVMLRQTQKPRGFSRPQVRSARPPRLCPVTLAPCPARS